jgi:hypothetical protein
MRKSIFAAMAAGLVVAPVPLLVTTPPVAHAYCIPWVPATCYGFGQMPQYRVPQYQVPQYHPAPAPAYHPPAPVYHPPAPQYHPPQAPQYHPPQQVPQHPQVPQQHAPEPQQRAPEPQQHPGEQPRQVEEQHPGQQQLHPGEPGQQLHPGEQQHPGEPGQQLHPGGPGQQQLHPGQPAQLHPGQPGQQLHPGGSGPGRPALLPSPNRLGADPGAIEKARTAPPVRVKPASPPKPPTNVDFNHQVQNVISGHGHNVDVVKAGNHSLVRPRHWDYIDYDRYHRPILYNPIGRAMTFRYFYDGAFRDAYVPAGGRMILDAANAGAYPFTAVGDDDLASGMFNGGAFVPPDGWDGAPPLDYSAPDAPAEYDDVSAYIPADDQTVQLPKVQMVGHDGSQPAGSQDTFMLDDTTLAWGQANDARNGGKITVTKTQPLPGVGPTDNGSSLVALAAAEHPIQPTDTWWPWALGGVLVLAAAGGGAWFIKRSHPSAEPATTELTTTGP